MADFLFTDYPSYTIDDIRLATTVWTNDAGDVFIKVNNGFISKAFKTLDLKTF